MTATASILSMLAVEPRPQSRAGGKGGDDAFSLALGKPRAPGRDEAKGAAPLAMPIASRRTESFVRCLDMPETHAGRPSGGSVEPEGDERAAGKAADGKRPAARTDTDIDTDTGLVIKAESSVPKDDAVATGAKMEIGAGVEQIAEDVAEEAAGAATAEMPDRPEEEEVGVPETGLTFALLRDVLNVPVRNQDSAGPSQPQPQPQAQSQANANASERNGAGASETTVRRASDPVPSSAVAPVAAQSAPPLHDARLTQGAADESAPGPAKPATAVSTSAPASAAAGEGVQETGKSDGDARSAVPAAAPDVRNTLTLAQSGVRIVSVSTQTPAAPRFERLEEVAKKDPKAALVATRSAIADLGGEDARPSPSVVDAQEPDDDGIRDDPRRNSSHDAQTFEGPRQVSPSGPVTPPSPSTPQTPTTVATPSVTVVDAIRAEASWAAHFQDSRAGQPHQVTSLKIQLNPVELGSVTAHLTVEDDGVSVELTAETSEAQQKLAADADTIVKALRAIGLEVDKVTVQIASRPETAQAETGQPARQQNFSAEGGARDQQPGSRQPSGPAPGEAYRPSADSQGIADRSLDGRYI